MKIGRILAIGMLLGALACRADEVSIPATSGAITYPFEIDGKTVVQARDTSIETGGRAVYTFSITNAGDYLIWAALSGKPGKSTTLKISLGARAQPSSFLWQFEPSDTIRRQPVGSKKNARSYRDYCVFSLPAGTHQLDVRGATEGTRIEQFIVRSHGRPAPPGSIRPTRQ